MRIMKYLKRKKFNITVTDKTLIMKNKKSRIVIVLVTAGLTFGILFALKGRLYKHHHRKHHCSQVDKVKANDNVGAHHKKVGGDTWKEQRDI